ncbi:fimbrial protein [Salmonella enterica]|uniref:Fimbrial protein n=1 Tax=Salmonella enterica I TaxID=59201 RepID=A0A3U9L8N5_SALET|nr:fimbrial protein [Salmonella enterica]AZT34373.1 fimbrial protein [Salmonella enterica subsp. enterica serovar Stanleyville]EAA6144036.1 fimbrial protein [Salmonella enterica subsp. enterica serovar Eboko]EAB9004889.1 fimbrial protein [Salmonella enterica subsp. enterica serovar Ajiobo]EAC1005497.1 fimbrial protein [Salmonella enterica subsp. enterica]ECY4209080.1 fimbrial protein [Salmonella enterica subsp. enterica serovar Typhimurium]
MTFNTPKYLARFSTVALALAVCQPVWADGTNLDVTFKATIRETTCDMTIEGASGADNTITIGDSGQTRLDNILSGSGNISAPFTLKIVECPDSLDSIKTTINGTGSTKVSTALINTYTGTSPAPTSYIGLTIARASALNAPFVINSTADKERLVWTTDEIKTAKAVPLVATMIATGTSAQVEAGRFESTATFEFTYE